MIVAQNRRFPGQRETGRPWPPAREEGAILLLVIWILALLSVVVLSWAQEWRTEIKLAANFRDDRRCYHLAAAGVYYALAKVTAAKLAEHQNQVSLSLGTLVAPDTWNGDQQRHLLELPGGQVEVRVADESGKINLNQADPEILANLFAVLGFSASKVPVMVDSILDWRSPDSLIRPHGAKSSYYLSLDQPYPAKSGKFDTVEELAWVRGFGAGANPARLSAYLTVQDGRQINLNTAPQEVMLALGLQPDLVSTLIQERQVGPLRSEEVMPRLSGDPQMQNLIHYITFNSSTFFSILATGMINDQEKARHTIKAIVRLDKKWNTPWKFLYWADDYPG
jgi:general secretion pathway protein K